MSNETPGIAARRWAGVYASGAELSTEYDRGNGDFRHLILKGLFRSGPLGAADIRGIRVARSRLLAEIGESDDALA
ncbi:hypothetical protein M728_001554 [Ensifer sp. WSM1721]